MKQSQEKKQFVLENLIYLIIWMIVLVVPLFAGRDQQIINWDHAKFCWKMIAPFFVLFLLNNYVLLPYLLTRKKLYLYLLFTLITIFVFFTAEPLIRNKGHLIPGHPPDTMKPISPPPLENFYPWEEFKTPPHD
jgi:hypothetical protein